MIFKRKRKFQKCMTCQGIGHIEIGGVKTICPTCKGSRIVKTETVKL